MIGTKILGKTMSNLSKVGVLVYELNYFTIIIVFVLMK
jgi:hypothetical protein